jgi:hypothetical protein
MKDNANDQAEDEEEIVEQGRLERIGVIAGLALYVKYRFSIKDFQLVAGTRNHRYRHSLVA